MLLKQKLSSRALVRLSMSFFLVFTTLNLVARIAPPQSVLWTDTLDGVRGAVLGAFLALAFLQIRARKGARV
jgi:hypothetical protein